MCLWPSDSELFELVQVRLYTPVVGDIRDRLADYRGPIEIGQVRVEPGDLVFGDLDGVVIVPRRVKQEVVTEALKKASGENLVRKEIENGLASTAAFQKFGIPGSISTGCQNSSTSSTAWSSRASARRSW